MTFEPRFKDLATMLHDVVGKYGDRPVLGMRTADGWNWTTYGQFGALVDQARGDRLAVISNNRIEWAVGAYAAFTLGAVWVPMYESQLDGDWQFILEDCGARICFVSGDAIAKR